MTSVIVMLLFVVLSAGVPAGYLILDKIRNTPKKSDYKIVGQERSLNGISFRWVIIVERDGIQVSGKAEGLEEAFNEACRNWRAQHREQASFHKEERKLVKYGYRPTKEAQ